jgi:ribonuclease M5
MLSKLAIKQTVIVEGRCDKAVLENVIDGTVIAVNGFGVYRDKKKLAMLRRYAEMNGAIILTDSDDAGRQIRDFIKEALRGCEIHHVYVPNLLEVEDTSADVLRKALQRFDSGFPVSGCGTVIDRERLFDDGLIGGADSGKRRKELLRFMNLPENLSVTALLGALNTFGLEEYERFMKEFMKE